jgi:hypothetical protein
LEAPAANAELSPAAAEMANRQLGAAQAAHLAAEANGEITDRVRKLAKRDLAVTSNVLRAWLQEKA